MNRKCEAAREERLAPLRESAIAHCIRLSRQSPEECRSYYRDFGDARNTGDRVLPRMFHNIPECAEAWEAETHYRLYPQ